MNFRKLFSLKDLKLIGATTNEKNNIIAKTPETVKKTILESINLFKSNI